jgi:hypothetical protein
MEKSPNVQRGAYSTVAGAAMMLTVAFLFAASISSTTDSPEVLRREATMPQEVAPSGKPPTSLPGSGTPEPASMLLLFGSAVGYGVYRLKQGKRPTRD